MSSRGANALARTALLVLICCMAAAVAVGLSQKPPREVQVGVRLTPIDEARGDRAQLPLPQLPLLFQEFLPSGARFDVDAPRTGGHVTAMASDSEEALVAARDAARDYARLLRASQDQWLRERLRSGEQPELQKLRRSLLDAPARFTIRYAPVAASAPDSRAPFRAALIGLLTAALATALLLGAARRYAAGGPGTAAPSWSAPVPPAAALGLVLGAAALAAALVAVTSAAPDALYTLSLVGLLFAAAFAYALLGGPAAIRALLIVVIAVAPSRGALLALASEVELPEALLTFNAIQPCLVAACALAALVAHRSGFLRQPPLLAAGWIVIAAVAALDFATQTVGLRLYAIGLAQYLVYPTMALLAWWVMGRRDPERLVWAFAALGVVVAISIFLNAVGVVSFVESAASDVTVRAATRYGGITGSYLHAGVFLGTTAVLVAGIAFSRWSLRSGILASFALGAVLGGIALTFTRAGFVIAAIGLLLVLIRLAGRDRVRLVAVGLASIALGFGFAYLGGVAPDDVLSRSGAGVAAAGGETATSEGEAADVARVQLWRGAITRFGWSSLPQQVLGQGLARTGNAGKLTSLTPLATESYPLKLLLEVGVVGVVAIGGFLLWAGLTLLRTAWANPAPLFKAVGAAGVALSADFLIYPTLEVQLLALIWWLLLVICLKAAGARGVPPGQLPLVRRIQNAVGESHRGTSAGS